MPLTPEMIEALPRATGVYMMRDKKNRIIYVGKALEIKNRVRAYLGQDTRPYVSHIREHAEKVDFVLTGNEKEALLLENQLIKTHRPRYNVLLRDDKTYVSIKLTVNHDCPAISITRRVVKDGARYFGPYSSAKATRGTLSAIGRIFPVRRCKDTEFANRVRPCLYYQIGLCLAPCVKKHATEDYKQVVEDLILFLEGKNTDLTNKLEKRMKKYAVELDFEKAAKIRDQIEAIKTTLVPQRVSGTTSTDADIFGVQRYEDTVSIAVLRIMNGRVADTNAFSVHAGEGQDFITPVIIQYYLGGRQVPPIIYSDELPEETENMTAILSELRSAGVKFKRPVRGKTRHLLNMANETASKAIAAGESALDEIAIHFKLQSIPWRIECYDISNLSETNAVGSRSVLTGGELDKSLYRHYKIKSVQGQNDFAMMHEVLSRRFKNETENMPDLIIIDGGKGQLAMSLKVMSELGIEGVPVVAMAKEHGAAKDRFFIPGRKEPVHLQARSRALLMLQNLRDEAHRFAITYHRKLRSKSTFV
ncbi:MAG TPA: excinuclease ABC subunit UvrC [Desulfomonilia bacterium]